MNARRRTAAKRSLPPNLYQKTNGYFYYRNPLTKKDKGIGHDKAEAVREAVAANLALEELKGKRSTVADWVMGKTTRTFASWAADYENHLIKRNELRPNSMAMAKSSIRIILTSDFASRELSSVTTEQISTFLEQCERERGGNSARIQRSRLVDMFKVAQQRGYVHHNPVIVTVNPRIVVQRDRLSIEQFLEIRKHAAPTLVNAMNIALLTAQRREDVLSALFEDCRDGFMWVIQSKTRTKIRISTALRLDAIDLSLKEAIEQCRGRFKSKLLVHHMKTINGAVAGEKIPLNYISKYFCRARAESGIKWQEGKTPPSFHEIRSLSERLYHTQYGPEFTQRLLGHKNPQMTALYHDLRGSEWIDVVTE